MVSIDAKLRKIVIATMASLGGPYAAKVSDLVRAGEWDSVANLQVSPSDYDPTEWRRYYIDSQATNLLRKCADLPTSFDRKLAAWETRLKAERQCCLTNIRFDGYLENHYGDDQALEPFLARVKEIFRSILGPLPRREALAGRFSKGVTIGSRRIPSFCLGDKIEGDITVTPSAQLLVSYLERGTAWERNREHAVTLLSRDYNSFFTVPKTSVTDRGCCKEALQNIWAQLGVGSHLRRRLFLTTAIELESAQHKHRSAVLSGSRSGELATIDLTSASDTVATNVVKFLCGPGWFELLDTLRARWTEHDGRFYRNEQFSSMGNGFTFELETILFYSIAKAVVGTGEVMVYGDDIIIPTKHYREVMLALNFFGFTPNNKKSFGDGPFRESCGQDAFSGEPVRSSYLLETPKDPIGWISLHNKLVRISDRLPELDYCPELRKAKQVCLGQVPRQYRVFGPRHVGDLAFHSDDESTWSLKMKWGIKFLRVIRPLGRKVPLHHFRDGTQMTLALLGAPSRGLGYRDNVVGYKIGYYSVS